MFSVYWLSYLAYCYLEASHWVVDSSSRVWDSNIICAVQNTCIPVCWEVCSASSVIMKCYQFKISELIDYLIKPILSWCISHVPVLKKLSILGSSLVLTELEVWIAAFLVQSLSLIYTSVVLLIPLHFGTQSGWDIIFPSWRSRVEGPQQKRPDMLIFNLVWLLELSPWKLWRK